VCEGEGETASCLALNQAAQASFCLDRSPLALKWSPEGPGPSSWGNLSMGLGADGDPGLSLGSGHPHSQPGLGMEATPEVP